MYQRLVKYCAGLIGFVALAGILLLPAYALLLGAAVLMPPILVGVTLSDAWTKKEFLQFRTYTRLFLALMVAPAALLAMAAPLRALLVGLLSFHPPALDQFHEGHAMLYGPLAWFLGDLVAYRVDLYWGLLATLVIFALALTDSVRRSMLVSQIRNLSTSRARSVAVGLAELSGRAVPVGKATAKAPIIRSWLKRTEDGYAHETEVNPFYLDDGTGRILVDARGAKVDEEKQAVTTAMHQVKLTQHEGKDGLPEGRLMPGDPVFVLGSVQINDDPDSRDDDPVVIKPKKSSLLRLDYYDLFFLGNGNEREQLAAFAESIRRGWTGVVMLLAITVWLSVNAWTNIRQVNELDLDAAPALFRAVSAPTLMERAVTVSAMGTKPALYWIDQLKQPSGDKDAIMQALHEAHLARYATPVLKQPAADIEHRDFRVSNHWLMTFEALPAGEWGYEYVVRQREASRETQIMRVRLKRAGTRLLASCDAYFSEYVSATRPVTARKLVFAFRDAVTGALQTAEIPAEPGWNRVRNVPLFERFSPAEYRVRISARRDYTGNLYEEDVWMAPEIRIDLR